jgi:hypothetical protein
MVFVVLVFLVLVGLFCCRVVLAIIGIPTALLQNDDEGILLDQGKLQFSVGTVVMQCMHMHCIITVSIAELQLILILWR